MAEILTDHEINQIRNRANVGITSDILALIASHRALAAERDAAYNTSAEIVETTVKTQDELGKRIRALESACEQAKQIIEIVIARELFAAGGESLGNEAHVVQVLEQLEGAIKHG